MAVQVACVASRRCQAVCARSARANLNLGYSCPIKLCWQPMLRRFDFVFKFRNLLLRRQCHKRGEEGRREWCFIRYLKNGIRSVYRMRSPVMQSEDKMEMQFKS